MLSDLSNCALHSRSYDGISTDCILFLCSPEGVGGAPSLMSSGHSQTHRYVSVFVQWRREELDGTAAISNFTAVEPAEELRQPLLLQAPRRNNCREFLQLAAPPELRTKPARRALKSPKRQAPSRGRRFASIRGCCRSFKSGGVICVSGVV